MNTALPESRKLAGEVWVQEQTGAEQSLASGGPACTNRRRSVVQWAA